MNSVSSAKDLKKVPLFFQRLLLSGQKSLLLCLLLVISSSLAQAATVTVFGPKTYARTTGQPATVTDTFSVSNTTATYELAVDNAGVASAVITLNGVPVFVESDFKPNALHLTKTVVLQARNELNVEVRSKPGSSVTVQVNGTAAATTLNVHAFQLDTTLADGKGPALGSGVQIQINGKDAGVTDATGTFSTPVAAGALEIFGRIPSQAVGSVDTSIADGQTLDVNVLLDFDKEAIDNAALTADEIANQLLDIGFTTLTLHFNKNGTPVPVSTIDSIDLIDRSGRPVSRVEANFSVDAQGAIHGANISALKSLFQAQQGIMTLRVMASDANGLVYQNDVSFYLARFTVSGKLVAPPSFSTLNTAGIQVTITLLGTPLTMTTTSAADGTFSFPRFPVGLIGFNSTTQQQGNFYYGQGQLLLNRNVSVSLVMRNQTDVKNGVLPLTVTTIFAPLLTAQDSDPDPLAVPADVATARTDAAANPVSSVTPALAATTNTVTVTSTAAAQDFPVTNSATLDVPAGTQKVTLSYNVFTQEWPFFVQSQSIFNDVWSLMIFGGSSGQQLFEITRNVNAQWFELPPLWQANGSTGQIQEDIDVSSLTANNQATQLTVVAVATDIGDGILPTTVNATLGAAPTITIDSVTHDNLTVATRSDGTYFSIPRPSATNIRQRTFTVKYTKPSDATISNLKVNLKTAVGAQLMTVVDEGPGNRVQVLDDTTLRATVTLGPASTVASQPPPLGQILYEFTLKATQNGTDITSDPKNSRPLNPLWRMPDGIARYSPAGTSPGDAGRDVGGDDWSAAQTYQWIQQNVGLLTSVNDISGEHARDLGHQTHARGVDIDIYHFHRFTGAVNAQSNYLALEARVRNALTGNAASLADVTSWVSDMRTGLGNLANNGSVFRLYSTIGNQISVTNSQGQVITLNGGWGQSLITTGSATATNGQVLDTGLGQWTNSNRNKVAYNAVHNNHIHILLQF
jgi:hypothetical protein